MVFPLRKCKKDGVYSSWNTFSIHRSIEVPFANAVDTKVPPNGKKKNRGYSSEHPIHLSDSNFRAVVFSGRPATAVPF